jgi:hypothetical protein
MDISLVSALKLLELYPESPKAQMKDGSLPLCFKGFVGIP